MRIKKTNVRVSMHENINDNTTSYCLPKHFPWYLANMPYKDLHQRKKTGFNELKNKMVRVHDVS